MGLDTREKQDAFIELAALHSAGRINELFVGSKTDSTALTVANSIVFDTVKDHDYVVGLLTKLGFKRS